MAPGSRLFAFASRWFDEQTVARVFAPMPAPMMRRVLARIIIFTGIGAGLLTLPIVVLFLAGALRRLGVPRMAS